MKSRAILFLIVYPISIFSFAQERWQTSLGRPGESEVSVCVSESYDNGYLVSGSYYNADGLVAKASKNGELLWDKVFVAGNSRVNFYSNSIISSGRKLLAGHSGQDPIAVCLNECGYLEWCFIFQNPENYLGGYFLDAIYYENGHSLLLGVMGNLDQEAEIYLYYIDPEGQFLWMKEYAAIEDHPDLFYPNPYNLDTIDGDFFISGDCYYRLSNNPDVFALRPMFIRIDENYDQEWLLPYGHNIQSNEIIGTSTGVLRENDSIVKGFGQYSTSTGYNGVLLNFNDEGVETDYIGIPNQALNDSLTDNSIIGLERTNDSMFVAAAIYTFSLSDIDMGEYVVSSSGNVYESQFHTNTLPAFYPMIKTTSSQFVFTGVIIEGEEWNILIYKLNDNLSSADFVTDTITYDYLCDDLPIASDTIDLSACGIITGSGETKYISTFGSTEEGNIHFYHRVYKQVSEDKSDWKLIKLQPDTQKWISAIRVGKSSDYVYVAMRSKLYIVNTDSTENPTWDSITYDLPNYGDGIQINCIERGDNRVWIGTDRGVFYLNDSDTSWVDYSENLPNVEVTDIKVSNYSVYVGTYGRGVWYASAPGCFVNGQPHITQPNETITSQLTKTYKTDIIVSTGNTFTVKGTLKMGADCRIIVERGAQLVIDGGTITNACPDMWAGIEVWGIPGQVLDSTRQGWAILKNQATIENAKIGVYTYKIENEVALLDFTGGIVQADNSTFKNNKTDVQILSAPDEFSINTVSLSKFNRCHFITDSSFYFFANTPTYHVSLSQTSKVSFTGNTFENTCSLDFAPEENRGVGINSFNSSFYAVPGNGINKFNSFNGLVYGIKIMDFGLTNVKVDSCFFNHNQTGIYASGNTFGAFNRNTFNITKDTIERPHGYTGIYLDACTGYQVEANEFYSDYDPLHEATYSRSFGLVINDSGPEDNLAYDNYFHNIGWATLAQNKNRNKGEIINGLQYKCSEFENNFSDIAVTWDENNPSNMNGIAEHQGSAVDSATASAGNLFSKIGKDQFSDFNNQGGHIIYHLPGIESMLDYPRLRPEFFTDETIKLVPNLKVSWTPDLGCPPMFRSKTKSELKPMIASNKANHKIYADSLDTKVDDGNTSALNLDIVTSIPAETMELRDELLSASPYLSDTVMMSAVEMENVLPNSIITEIMTANPQSSRNENMLNALNERDNPPNESEMASIHTNDTAISKKELLESKRDFYRAKKQQAVNQFVRLTMNETLLAINDSIEAALANISTPMSYYIQAFCRYNKADSAGVIDKLTDINSDFDLSGYETDMLDAFQEYFNLLLVLQSEDKQIIEIDSTRKNILATIMQNSGGILQAYCRNILIHTDGLVYNEPFLLPETSSNKSTKLEKPFDNFTDERADFIKLYPNPAKNYITLEYDLPYGPENVIAEIITITGHQVEVIKLNSLTGQRIIDLRNYRGGSYLIRAWADGKVLQNKKFTKF